MRELGGTQMRCKRVARALGIVLVTLAAGLVSAVAFVLLWVSVLRPALLINFQALDLAGIALAAYIYARGRQTADKLAVRFESAHRLLANKYYVDEIYHAIFVRPLRKLGDGCFGGDNWVIDSLLWIITALPRCLGALLGLTQRGNLQTYALLMLIGLAAIVFFVLKGM